MVMNAIVSPWRQRWTDQDQAAMARSCSRSRSRELLEPRCVQGRRASGSIDDGAATLIDSVPVPVQLPQAGARGERRTLSGSGAAFELGSSWSALDEGACVRMG
jgi:hypothetical protein